MKGCLQDDVLVLLQAGEGSRAERDHLAACPACGTRYGALASDLAVIRRAFDSLPPRHRAARRAESRRRGWMQAAAGLAIAGVIAGGLWMENAGRPGRPGAPAGSPGAEADVLPVLQATSAGLFSAIERGAAPPAEEVLFGRVLTALDGWCEWPVALGSDCEPEHRGEIGDLATALEG
ncbi:MAG TPA: hypothetical protein VGW35_14770 [Methylomirabilota bacterium]|nr:hypothetical protein [Methylomirabilota bacterium]